MATLWSVVCDAMASDQDHVLMREAIRLMRDAGVVKKTGGPFGAVIAKDGRVVAAAGNSVVKDLDPSAHAEVNAIRAACQKLGTWDLSGCVLYASSRCCPMCFSAAHWAGISKIYYGAGWEDYSDFYDDSEAIKEMNLPPERQAMAPEQLLRQQAIDVWQAVRQERGMAQPETT